MGERSQPCPDSPASGYRGLLSDDSRAAGFRSTHLPSSSRLTCLSLGPSELKPPPARARTPDLSLWRLIVMLSGLTAQQLPPKPQPPSALIPRGPRRFLVLTQNRSRMIPAPQFAAGIVRSTPAACAADPQFAAGMAFCVRKGVCGGAFPVWRLAASVQNQSLSFMLVILKTMSACGCRGSGAIFSCPHTESIKNDSGPAVRGRSGLLSCVSEFQKQQGVCGVALPVWRLAASRSYRG